MAQIYGIELKSVKTFEGSDGYGYSANCYLDGKKIGTVADYGDGSIVVNYDIPKASYDKLVARINSYYKVNPDVDTSAIYDMTLDEFLSKKDNLPTKNCDANDDFVLTCFFETLLNLIENEKIFKKAVKKHPAAFIVVADFYHLAGVPTPLPLTYTCYNDKHIQEVEAEALAKSKTAYLTVYKSLDDFKIQA
jgi:hypothetical protein